MFPKIYWSKNHFAISFCFWGNKYSFYRSNNLCYVMKNSSWIDLRWKHPVYIPPDPNYKFIKLLNDELESLKSIK